MKLLDKMDLPYDHDSSYELKDKNMLQWDFIIYTQGDPLFIEYDGRGHFEPVQFGGMSQEKAQKVLETCQAHDKLKNDFCDNNNYSLLRIPYTQFGNIPQLVT
jgi:hypothetical protein